MSSEIVITDKDVPSEVMDAVTDGRKVIAIKLLREATGLGLANAKVIVDRLSIQHAPRRHYQSAIREDGGNRRLVALVTLAAVLFAAWRYLAAG